MSARKIIVSHAISLIITATAFAGFAGTAFGAIIAPSDDAVVINTDPDGNYGQDERIFTWTAYMAGSRGRSYIKFSLNGLPDRSMISSATLNLYQYDAGGFVPWVSIYHVSDDTWTEDDVTWNNRPLPDPSSPDTPNAPDLINRLNIGYGEGWVSFDLLSSGMWDYNADAADGYVTLLIKSDEKGDERHVFYSSEETVAGNFAPYLEIATVPAPAALPLLGAGVLGLLAFRREKKEKSQ